MGFFYFFIFLFSPTCQPFLGIWLSICAQPALQLASTMVFGVVSLAASNEMAIYNWTNHRGVGGEKRVPKFWDNTDFVLLYKEKLCSILFNLPNPSNPELLAMVVSKGITPKQLLAMSPQEMHPKLHKPVMRRLEMEDMIKTGQYGEVAEGMIQCAKCKSKRVIWYMAQTRSADEPATVFCTCPECSKRWRMAG